MQVAHNCLNKLYVLPEHYSLVTRSVNYFDHKVRDGTLHYGEDHHNAKLTQETAQKIADSWLEKGVSQQSRGLRFKVTQATISAIDRRHTWPDIKHPNGLPFKGMRGAAKKIRENAKARVLSSEDLPAIREALRKRSTPLEEANAFTGTSCHIWNKKFTDIPHMMIFGVQRSAHRWAYIASTGKIHDHLQARHMYGNRVCVNPDHMQWGTAFENAADKVVHRTHGRKLSNEQVIAIRKSTEGHTALSKKYKVAVATIFEIRKRKIYKEV